MAKKPLTREVDCNTVVKMLLAKDNARGKEKYLKRCRRNHK